MTLHRFGITLAILALLAGCTSASTTTTATTDNGADASTNDNDSTGSGASDALTISGHVQTAGQTARAVGQTLPLDEGYLVVAQSAATGELYQGTSDETGAFQIDIPKSEAGETFMVSIVRPDGRAAGPVVFEQDGDHGMTGLALMHAASLGTIDIPGDPADAPLTPGKGADTADMVASDVITRLDANGVPVGLSSAGKGPDARGGAASGPVQAMLDADQDGLPDVIDADDNGNGIVDEFDGAGDVGGILPGAGIRLNFFMNLKIDNTRASVYYGGTADQIADALRTDTIVTFEILAEPGAIRKPVAARLLERPGPAYLPLMEKMSDGSGGLMFATWADSDYAFDVASDRLQAFARPNALLTAGDTFAVLVEFNDGSKRIFARMINYVFKNIPHLREFGESGSLSSFTGAQPIEFDGARDLVLVFNPPIDDTGAFLTGQDYQFEIFYNAADGRQLNGDIDRAATFPAPPAGFSTNNFSYNVPATSLTLASDNTFTVTLPKDIFVDSVQTSSGAQAVSSYKIDIAAQKGGNAAIMLQFKKH